MNILKEVQEYAEKFPEREAVRRGDTVLTYGALWEYSDRLAAWILYLDQSGRLSAEKGKLNTEMKEADAGKKHPIAVYGHKNPWMLVCFLACVKAGHAYCPIDWSVPEARTEMILRSLPSELVLSTEELHADAGEKRVLTLSEIQAAAETAREQGLKTAEEADWVRADETWYIIFTSGSTGAPKGVQISADCLNHYLDWSVGLGSSREEKRGQVFLNQAPFSFDLSVMDLYTCLAVGGTLYCLEKSVQSDYRLLMQALSESGANVWVSTPSFAEVCLSERSFSEELMPGLEIFLFCGETLGNRTVRKLQERFPKAKIVNTYGPTESTVAVTEVLVTPELAEQTEPLPVGRAKPGTRIEIWDEDGCALPEGQKGEVIILGDTVSTGYYRQPELTERAFFELEETAQSVGEDGLQEGKITAGDEAAARNPQKRIRGYRTGDKGYLENGMLFYCGRIDLQIKLHGYRIELEDIENNIRRLTGIEHAVVLPNVRNDKVKSLTAYVVEKEKPQDEREETARLKQELLQYVPDYMVPKKFIFLDQMPMTNNGKADRKKLGGNDS